MRVTLIHNPDAGEGEPSANALLTAMRRHGHEAADRSSNAWNAERETADLVVAAGGDGTVAGVAKRLAGAGRGCRSRSPDRHRKQHRGFSWDRRRLATDRTGRPVAGGARRSFDVGRAICHQRRAVRRVGRVWPVRRHDGEVPSQAGRRRECGQSRGGEWTRLGPRCGACSAAARPRHWRVELDGRDFSGRYLLVEAMNTRRIGPASVLAPDANPGDGLLDVVFVCDDAGDRARLDAHLRQPAVPEPSPPPLTVRRARNVLLDCGGDRAHLDDKLWEPGRAGGPAAASTHTA